MSKQPNILFILADQLGLRHCGYAGAAKARTPNIDAFAAQGVSFSNMVSSSPVCAAYRASLFTGKYTTSTGMVINELRLNPGHECLGHAVTRAGYETAYIGKWHLYANELGHHDEPRNSFVPPGPHRLGFDGHWAAYGFHHDYYNTYYHRDTPEKIFYGDPASGAGSVYEPDAQTDMMIRWLGEERAQRDAAARQDAAAQQDAAARRDTAPRPFCAFLSYGTPHDPWSDENVPEEYRKLFAETDLPNPPNYKDENDPYADGWARLTAEDRENLQAWRRNYYAMAANLDWNFGRLLAALDTMGLAEDTIVVFSSDHGEMFGAQGRRAKNIFYEEAARIPLLIRWPGHIAPGTACDACVSTVDIMPTVLGFAGLPVPKSAEGMDCHRLALGEGGPEPEAALLQNTGACAAWEDGHEWRALRDKRWTYAKYRVDGAELLFDNAADPLQMRNLAQEPAHRDTLDRFRRMLAEKMASLNDTFPESTWYRDNWIEDRKIARTATFDPTSQDL